MEVKDSSETVYKQAIRQNMMYPLLTDERWAQKFCNVSLYRIVYYNHVSSNAQFSSHILPTSLQQLICHLLYSLAIYYLNLAQQ